MSRLPGTAWPCGHQGTAGAHRPPGHNWDEGRAGRRGTPTDTHGHPWHVAAAEYQNGSSSTEKVIQGPELKKWLY